MNKQKTITPRGFEATWYFSLDDHECDWCGSPIYRNDSMLIVECSQRGLKYYCGEGCEGNHRNRFNSNIED